MRNWQGDVMFQLRNKGAKEVLNEPISKFYFMNSKFEVKL